MDRKDIEIETDHREKDKEKKRRKGVIGGGEGWQGASAHRSKSGIKLKAI